MKYMNHLRKLALLSSLALSFSVAVQADGTLPLPVQDANGKLVMADDASSILLNLRSQKATPTVAPKVGSGAKAIESCNKGEQFYVADGLVNFSGKDYKVQGVCKSLLSPSTRTVVGIDGKDLLSSSQFLLLTGSLSGPTNDAGTIVETDTMSGDLQIKPFVTVTPTGAEAEVDLRTPFTLYRTL